MAATVLLVEDQPDLATVMTLALERAGLEVIAVDSGAHAIRVTELTDVDVVVMDRGLPDMDGVRAAALMRAAGFYRSIVVLSGYEGAEHLAACRDAGVNRVLTKPLPLAELADHVHAAAKEGQLARTR